MFSSCQSNSSNQGLVLQRTPVLQRCGTALVVLLLQETHSKIFLALRFDVPFKRLLWAVSKVFIKFAVSHMHRDVWATCNNLRAWVEHYPITLINN